MSAFADPGDDLTPREVADRLARGEIQLVDVREPYEVEAGRIEGSRHVELEHLASHAETIDHEKPVVFHCRLGARSAQAARAFRAAGWEAHNMAGGIQAWVDSGLPLDRPDARVAEH